MEEYNYYFIMTYGGFGREHASLTYPLGSRSFAIGSSAKKAAVWP
jgi:hypothetical protein